MLDSVDRARKAKKDDVALEGLLKPESEATEDMVGGDQTVGGESGLHSLYVVLWAWLSTMMMMLSFSACAWHRRRMQRRREG